MAKGRPDPNWQQKILEWQASGKKAQVWCKEQQIPQTTFSGWKKRLKNSFKATQQNAQSSTDFIELKDHPQSNSETCSGISLEYHGIKIHLNSGFNQVVLKQCLACLGGVSC
jgi:hypothetical protein